MLWARYSPDIMPHNRSIDQSIDNDAKYEDNQSMSALSDYQPVYKLSPETSHGIHGWNSPSTSNYIKQCPLEEDQEDVKSFDLNVVLPKNVCPTTCSVCERAATGYHYDVPSCNGCKTFFRRTILDQRSFTCKRDQKCFDSSCKEKKIACRACRFQKCVDVGMNPLAIQMDTNQTSNMIVMNIMKKRKTSGAAPDENDYSEVKIIPSSLYNYEDLTESLIDQLVYLDIRTDQLRHAQFDADPCDNTTLREVIKQRNIMSIVEKLKPMENWPLPPRPNKKMGCPKQKLKNERKSWMYHDLFGAIEYAKTFPFFCSLNDDDKVQLLKHVSLLCSNLTQAFYSYTKKSDVVLHPDGTIPKAVLLDCGVFSQSAASIFRAACAPLIRMRIDRKEYVLLKAILLCNAAVPELSETGQAILTAERNKYAAALLSYCMATKGAIKGPAHFADIIGIVDTLQHQAKNQKDMHILIRMRWQRPRKRGILGEVFDA